MKNRSLIAALAVAGLLSACVRQTAPIVSTTTLGDYEWPVGLASGTSTATYILGFGPIGDDTVGTAIAHAIGKDGDALINTAVDRRTTYFPAPFLPIVMRVETRVFGTVIVYIDENGDEILGADQGKESDAQQTSYVAQTAPIVPPYPAVPPPVAEPAGPAKPMVWVRSGLSTDDFVFFFQNLWLGAAIDLTLADGRRVSGNFAGISKTNDTIKIGKGLFGARIIPVASVQALASRTIRGEPVHLTRKTP